VLGGEVEVSRQDLTILEHLDCLRVKPSKGLELGFTRSTIGNDLIRRRAGHDAGTVMARWRKVVGTP
jgi:hypothetical protein